MDNHPLQTAIRTANILNLTQFALGCIGLGLLFLAPSSEDSHSRPDYAAARLFMHLVLIVFTAWNSRRELRLIPAGRSPRLVFYLTNIFLIAVTLLLLSRGVAHGKVHGASPEFFLLLAVTFPSIYSMRVAGRLREMLATRENAKASTP